ncbi:Hypothetical protein CINCED_3A022016 [Cinara cedri]|uniref:Uncharacterized protein n=1 Tax=Cinara cedri TaxID=506608 RepID=A0A5E4N222_9HEMI|nr:Hypothetical protein CINCED_3A022016 [Cinara cedri]
MDTFWAFLMGLITASVVILAIWLIVFGWCGVNRLENDTECMCDVSSESFGGKIASYNSDRVENTNKKTFNKYYNKWRHCGSTQ